MSHGHGTAISKTWTYFEGQWHDGNVKILGVRSHGAWLGSTVFDGARAFESVIPDPDLNLARVIGLLRDAGHKVEEAQLSYKVFQDADELFTVGNFAKVSPVTRIEARDLQPGPVYQKARELYWAFAHQQA